MLQDDAELLFFFFYLPLHFIIFVRHPTVLPHDSVFELLAKLWGGHCPTIPPANSHGLGSMSVLPPGGLKKFFFSFFLHPNFWVWTTPHSYLRVRLRSFSCFFFSSILSSLPRPSGIASISRIGLFHKTIFPIYSVLSLGMHSHHIICQSWSLPCTFLESFVAQDPVLANMRHAFFNM